MLVLGGATTPKLIPQKKMLQPQIAQLSLAETNLDSSLQEILKEDVLDISRAIVSHFQNDSSVRPALSVDEIAKYTLYISFATSGLIIATKGIKKYGKKHLYKYFPDMDEARLDRLFKGIENLEFASGLAIASTLFPASGLFSVGIKTGLALKASSILRQEFDLFSRSMIVRVLTGRRIESVKEKIDLLQSSDKNQSQFSEDSYEIPLNDFDLESLSNEANYIFYQANESFHHYKVVGKNIGASLANMAFVAAFFALAPIPVFIPKVESGIGALIVTAVKGIFSMNLPFLQIVLRDTFKKGDMILFKNERYVVQTMGGRFAELMNFSTGGILQEEYSNLQKVENLTKYHALTQGEVQIAKTKSGGGEVTQTDVKRLVRDAVEVLFKSEVWGNYFISNQYIKHKDRFEDIDDSKYDFTNYTNDVLKNILFSETAFGYKVIFWVKSMPVQELQFVSALNSALSQLMQERGMVPASMFPMMPGVGQK